MFKAGRWRAEKNKIKAVFKFQFKATQVPVGGWEAMVVTLVPADAGKPSLRSEKTAVVNGECHWLNPIYETVKLNLDQKNGKIGSKIYQFIVSATGSAKSGVLGETNINLADYAVVYKPTSVSLQLQDSDNRATLHVIIQRVQGDAEGREVPENGETQIETSENRGATGNKQRRTLRSQLSDPEFEESSIPASGANAEEGSFINNKALIKFHSAINMPLHDDLSGNLRKSSSSDGISVSGSESSSGQHTPKGNGIKNNIAHQGNASMLSPLSSSTPPRNIGWPLALAINGSTAGLTNSSEESGRILEKQKSDCDVLARQLELSELELQTLRKQVVKERRRGQDFLRELSSLKEERDALRKEVDELKASKKRAADDENVSAMMQFGAKDPWSMLEEMKKELDHEKNLNSNLQLQLQKTQESNSELIFAVRDLEGLLEQKNMEKSSDHEDSQGLGCQNHLSHSRNLEVKPESFQTTSDHEEEQYELDILIKERNDMKLAYCQEQKILNLNSELELYKKDHEDLEIQIEQLALDYEILKQENHDISSRLEQTQLREQLRMQYDCSAHLAIINDLESHIETLEKELEKQAEAYEANLANVIQAKVEQEQRAIKAEGELRKTRWKNASTVKQLQEEFKRLSSQISTTFCANEDLVMNTLEESRALRMEKCRMEALLEKNVEELSSLQSQHHVKCQLLLSLVDFKTKEAEELHLELRDKRKELDDLRKSDEARQKAFREENSILIAEMEQLSREKSLLLAEIEQKEKLVAEIQEIRTSRKDMELMLQKRNLERNVLVEELSVLKEESKSSLEELNTLRRLKDDQEATVRTLTLKVEALTAQYNDLKNGLPDDSLEKENLRKEVLLLRGSLRKEADNIASIEKRFKDKKSNLTVSEGIPMINTRGESKSPYQGAHGSERVADLHEDYKPFDDESDSNEKFQNDNTRSLNISGGYLLEKMVQGEQFTNYSHEDHDERIRSNFNANTQTEVEASVSCPGDPYKIAGLLSQMAELKQQNESMEADLKEMQERYSEMSLRFAEVEGERQQLVIKIRTLKNATKN
ncbi:paramyosin-like isoform X2 [Asparagus officinalis]|uniref:paramyosin-like isoform X2 n=1 Tax=Asparagus officinalis TaxID=4686 RepID=UPI00098E6685|nr:paramyosin-like isoform X2 [Asparagus officinalis]